MSNYNWMEMMEKMQDIRLFCALHTKRPKKNGITSAQEMDLLSRIVLTDKAFTPQDLGSEMGLSKSAVSRLIDHLEKKEFLQKQYRQDDKRSYILQITKKGNLELDQTYRYYLEPVYKLEEILGAERFDALTTQIKEINHLLRNEKRR